MPRIYGAIAPLAALHLLVAAPAWAGESSPLDASGTYTAMLTVTDNKGAGDFTTQAVTVSVPPPASKVVFAAIGDYGSGSSNAANVAALVASWTPDFVITAGDNRYGTNSMDAAVGRFYCDFLADAGTGTYCNGGNVTTNAFFPSPGNHDYSDGGGINEYLSYFTLPGINVQTSGTSGSERYYDFIKGPVHLFALDSDGARNSPSDMAAQQAWLQQQLAASTSPWQIVYLHHAPFSSASNGSDPEMQWPFTSWGADAVISAHDHTYERLAIDGIPYFVDGLGGASKYDFGTPVAGSQVRYNGDYGAMRITATDNQMTFEFLNTSGTVVDSHTIQKVIVNVRIASGSDDVEERHSDGVVDLNSTTLELGNDPGGNEDQTVGLRFNSLDIPQGATILSAYLDFVVDETNSTTTNVTIRAHAVDNAPAFSSSVNDVTNRPLTSASTDWNIAAWNTIGAVVQSPDISTVVQEVVARAGWTVNSSMAFIIDGTGERTAAAFEGVAASAPLLHVEYTQPSNTRPTAAFTAATSGLTANFADASSDIDGIIVSWSWDFGDGNTSTMQNPSHTYAASGTYTAMLTVTDNGGAGDFTTQAIVLTDPNEPVDHVAVSEQHVSGSVSGTYVDTHTNNGVAEIITETTSRGKLSDRHSFVEIIWRFEVATGVPATIHANAWMPLSSDGDDCEISVSTDGVNFQPMFLIASTVDDDNYTTYPLGTLSSGTVWVRLVDTDRTPGNSSKDRAYVDHLFIRTHGGTSASRGATDFAATPSSDSQIDLAWTNNTANREKPFSDTFASDNVVPTRVVLEQNSPNPFNPSTTIRYALPTDALVQLMIFDVAGRRIHTLVKTRQSAGRHTVTWDGRNHRGASVSSGIYFCVLRTGGESITRRMILLK